MPSASQIDDPQDTEWLLSRVGRGDGSAVSPLLDRHRRRLKKMVVVRLDERLAARVDPSDVVQEALIEAAGKLANYASERPLPFFPWLRQLTIQRMAQLRRTHLATAKRAVDREERLASLPDRSAWLLADRIVTSETGPHARMIRDERRRAVHEALAAMPEADREVLVLRHLEHLTSVEIAAVMGTTESAVKMRHLRALRRMRDLLKGHGDE